MQKIKIADIPNGGAANGGQDIFFDVKTDDVQEYRVLCPYGEVGAIRRFASQCDRIPEVQERPRLA